jgi:hypothetical protein
MKKLLICVFCLALSGASAEAAFTLRQAGEGGVTFAITMGDGAPQFITLHPHQQEKTHNFPTLPPHQNGDNMTIYVRRGGGLHPCGSIPLSLGLAAINNKIVTYDPPDNPADPKICTIKDQ